MTCKCAFTVQGVAALSDQVERPFALENFRVMSGTVSRANERSTWSNKPDTPCTRRHAE